MFQQDDTVGAVVLESLFDVDTGFGMASLAEENPGIGVEVVGVLGIQVDTLPAHFFCLVQLNAVETEIVGIIVQAASVVGLPLQARVIGGVGLTVQSLLVVQLGHHLIEIGG